MPRRFTEPGLVVASHNEGKVREIADLLAPFGLDITSAGQLNLPEPEETGDTFIANAELKAKAAVEGANMPALADDSGLAVEGLSGDPGLYSARWAGAARDFNIAMALVQEKLGDNPNRRAYFISVLSLAWPDGHVESFEGRIYGTMVWPPRGDKGFGYDPMFQPDGYDVTFGELDYDEKQRISHRAVAFQKLIDGCFREP
ncbi:MAG: RdgB/HAM1 family non-canonical purine NTP pyrophosphatase [Alphaproteobacteria bacterium]|jgi:XTP/dITP diphosphohydrolase|nr:RdgB/HAM1 family non-canonical purine NTP pyrophosphatase [Alphaproteobacteria bacterium]MDP6831085.1 RdgB/HAM1 family non-canonical purine NTP pyrophosphatase [Alphaproteobacteria bacterium]MDP6876058.1 RdgB/HAM1 family non-canonical purine NTP pyrophosphatase [Alphaproteobacteria bacterium]